MPRPHTPYWLVSTKTHGPHWIAAPNSLDALVRYATWAITKTGQPPNLPAHVAPIHRDRHHIAESQKMLWALTDPIRERTQRKESNER